MLTGLLIIDCADFNEWKKEARLEGTLAACCASPPGSSQLTNSDTITS
jgi:hypothetical protein